MALKEHDGAPWVPLKINNDGVATDEDFTRNIEATLGRGYTRLNEFIESQSGSISVCGFAPSLRETWRHLTGDVMACNRAHDFLIDQGVVPKWCLLMDPLEVVAEMVTPHEEVTYLVASRCHESVFEKLRGAKVVVWHAAGDRPIIPLLEKHGVMEPTVNGGTATVTRGMVLAVAMGYTDIHIFGADSSFAEGSDTHLKKSLVEERPMQVMVDGRLFQTTGWMTLQVEDIRILCPELTATGNRFTFYGQGLLQHVAKTLGYDVKEYHEELAAHFGPDFAASQLKGST